jgi:hypothetical protein
MKKTNFVVIFWLILALIGFIQFIMNFSSLWTNISYLIVPMKNNGTRQVQMVRELIRIIPMLILDGVVFYIGLKQGLKYYKEK